MRRFILLVVIFGGAIKTETSNIIEAQCKGSSKCLGLKECTPFMALLDSLEKPLKPSVVSFLRSQQCGFQDGFPKVCCRVIPQGLRVMKYASSTPIPVKVNNLSSVTENAKQQIPDALADEIIENTTKMITQITSTRKRATNKPKNMKKLSEEINRALMADFFDSFSPYDLFRRRRGAKNKTKKYAVEIEIR